MNVLEVIDVKKSIKGKEIVRGINLTVKSSEVFGFLGPNGAGKTTTIRMIVGLIKPTAGAINICGHSLSKDFVKAMSNIGCIVENPEMYTYMSGMDNLKQFGAMKGHIEKSRYEEVIKLVGLENRINDKVGTYSLGMKQRLGVAQAILSKPKLLILDEPTNGLDPAGITEFRGLINRLAHQEGMGVFVSSHLLSEIQMMCDRVAIIRQGVIIKEDRVDNLLNEQQRVLWQVSDVQRAVQLLSLKWGLEVDVIDSNNISSKVDFNKLGDINSDFIKEGISVMFVQNQTKTLENLFLEMTRGDEIA